MIVAPNDAEKIKLKDEYEKRKDLFIESYGLRKNDNGFAPPYFYNPVKPINEAKAVLETIETSLTLPSVGIKLKRMVYKKEHVAEVKICCPWLVIMSVERRR